MSEINVVGEFEKVSFEQFLRDMTAEYYHGVTPDDGFADIVKDLYDQIVLPQRATPRSAGYDIRTPTAFSLKRGESVNIPTGIRVKIGRDGYFLACVPRSSLGFKHGLMLANTVGVIDQDYYYAANEGHIFCKLVNHGDHTVEINQGERIIQGIFLPYAITFSDEPTFDTRTGGIGSTGK